jgi:sugar O-acyltransferase (sialic acid O-acetyltransferase NeuD family)
MTRKIIILGTGGNCREIIDLVHTINQVAGRRVYECAGFLDDDSGKHGVMIDGVTVLGSLHKASEYNDCWFINGIGSADNFWRKEQIIDRCGVTVDRFATLLHPLAFIARTAQIGRGTVLFANVTVGANAKIGDHVFVLSNVVISHDTTIGDYTCITGGVCLAGGVQVGSACYLGTNATVGNDLIIGDSSLVGMGSVVLDHVPANTVVVGNPARFLRKTGAQPGIS